MVHTRKIQFHAPLIQIGIAHELQSSDASSAPLPGPTNSRPIAPDSEGNAKLVELLHQVVTGIQEIEKRRKANLHELQETAVELAIDIAEKIICEKLEHGTIGIKQRITDALEKLDYPGKLIVSANQQDVDQFKEILQSSEFDGQEVQIEFRIDHKLNRGDCLLETGETGLIATIDWQLEDLRKALLKGISDAQVERRKIKTDGEELRRYPDRRETA